MFDPEPLLLDKLKGLFGGSSASETISESTSTTTTSSTTSSSASGNASTGKDEADKPKKPVVKEEKIPLSIEVTFPSIPPMTVQEKRDARAR
jgi:hypoxia up-regulated 1